MSPYFLFYVQSDMWYWGLDVRTKCKQAIKRSEIQTQRDLSTLWCILHTLLWTKGASYLCISFLFGNTLARQLGVMHVFWATPAPVGESHGYYPYYPLDNSLLFWTWHKKSTCYEDDDVSYRVTATLDLTANYIFKGMEIFRTWVQHWITGTPSIDRWKIFKFRSLGYHSLPLQVCTAVETIGEIAAGGGSRGGGAGVGRGEQSGEEEGRGLLTLLHEARTLLQVFPPLYLGWVKWLFLEFELLVS